MIFLVSLLAACAFAFVLRNPLLRWPGVFYGLALVLDVVYLLAATGVIDHYAWTEMYLSMQKCTLAFGLFAVVMFVGVFSRASKVRQWLQPVRGTLSIVAWILCLGHVAMYGASYLPRVLDGGQVSGNVLAAFALACVLVALLMVLGVTSLVAVKKALGTSRWKAIQLLAYPFFGLVFLHVLLMLLPSAATGGLAAQQSVAVYGVVLGIYAVLRAVRAVADKRGGLKASAVDAPSSDEEAAPAAC